MGRAPRNDAILAMPQTPPQSRRTSRGRSPALQDPPSSGTAKRGAHKLLRTSDVSDHWLFSNEYPSPESQKFLESLRIAEHTPPTDKDFSSKGWANLQNALYGCNESKVVQDIGHFIIPSAEKFARHATGAKARRLELLIETVNQSWSDAQRVGGTIPKPDKCVGFNRDAFDQCHLNFIEDENHYFRKENPFKGNGDTFFPCFAGEAKSTARESLERAHDQNKNTMKHVMHGLVELFKRAGRADDLDGHIVGFSISYDQTTTTAFAYYLKAEGSGWRPGRALVTTANIVANEGGFRWTGYNISRTIYETWMPKHLAFIREAIDRAVNPESDSESWSKFWSKSWSESRSESESESEFESEPEYESESESESESWSKSWSKSWYKSWSESRSESGSESESEPEYESESESESIVLADQTNRLAITANNSPTPIPHIKAPRGRARRGVAGTAHGNLI